MIETARLLLRPHAEADFEGVAAMMADPVVVRFVCSTPMSRAESWQRLLRQAGLWALTGYGPFAVVEKASGRFVGDVGIADYRRGLGAEFDPFPEAGWITAAWAHGKGYATEAALAAHEWFDRRGRRRTVCLIQPDNLASMRVAAKLGYAAFGAVEYQGVSSVMLAREG